MNEKNYPNLGQVVELKNDKKMEEKKKTLSQDAEKMTKNLIAAEQLFKKVTGINHNPDSNTWKWFITEVFPTIHRLSYIGEPDK